MKRTTQNPRWDRIRAFIGARLRRGTSRGLHLTLGLLTIVISTWWFGGVAEDILTNDPLVTLDKQLADWMGKHAVPGLTAIVVRVTFFGSVMFLTLAALMVAIVLAAQRAWYRLSMLALASGGGSLLNLVVKQLFHRERPVFENPMVHLESYSFPSGHTMGATIFYGLTALFLIQSVGQWRWRVLVGTLAILLILLIGASRIYLGAHYLSDVLGAMAMGLGWLSLSVTAIEFIQRRRRESKTATGTNT